MDALKKKYWTKDRMHSWMKNSDINNITEDAIKPQQKAH